MSQASRVLEPMGTVHAKSHRCDGCVLICHRFVLGFQEAGWKMAKSQEFWISKLPQTHVFCHKIDHQLGSRGSVPIFLMSAAMEEHFWKVPKNASVLVIYAQTWIV